MEILVNRGSLEPNTCQQSKPPPQWLERDWNPNPGFPDWWPFCLQQLETPCGLESLSYIFFTTWKIFMVQFPMCLGPFTNRHLLWVASHLLCTKAFWKAKCSPTWPREFQLVTSQELHTEMKRHVVYHKKCTCFIYICIYTTFITQNIQIKVA